LLGLGTDFREKCREEMVCARKDGLLTDGALSAGELAREAGSFARFVDPQELLDAEWKVVRQVANELLSAGHRNLGRFLGLRPRDRSPLLRIAARYFFRRAVEEDGQLFRGLAFSQLEAVLRSQRQSFDALGGLQHSQRQAFDELHQALAGGWKLLAGVYKIFVQ